MRSLPQDVTLLTDQNLWDERAEFPLRLNSDPMGEDHYHPAIEDRLCQIDVDERLRRSMRFASVVSTKWM